jgi:hypothetical protein
MRPLGHIGNLADRAGQHNRSGRARTVGPLLFARRNVALTVASRYGRRERSPRRIIREVRMTTFDKREEGFEKKFAMDEELRFKANARRNKMLGLWAAEKMGLTGAEAEAYAKEVVASDFEEAGDHDVFRKIRKDFDDKGVAQSDHQIRRTMTDLMEVAVAQIKGS